MSRLVKASDISRTLFYYYYQDIFDVLEDAFSSGMSQVIDECFEIENPKDSISYLSILRQTISNPQANSEY